MKNIIVPIDFSEQSIAGIEFALIIAQKFKSDIHLVYAIKDRHLKIFHKKEEEEEFAKSRLENLVNKYIYHAPKGAVLDFTIKNGKIFKAVNSMVSSPKDSLIVMSAHGCSGYEHLFVGGNTFKIVSAAKCPVLLVRNMVFPRNLHNIVVPLDISFESKYKIPVTIELAKAFDCKLHLISVSSSAVTDIRNQLRLSADEVTSILEKEDITYCEELLLGDNITDLTIGYAEKTKSDIIVIMSEQIHNKSNIMGQYAHQMINESPIPVLIIPSKR